MSKPLRQRLYENYKTSFFDDLEGTLKRASVLVVSHVARVPSEMRKDFEEWCLKNDLSIVLKDQHDPQVLKFAISWGPKVEENPKSLAERFASGNSLVEDVISPPKPEETTKSHASNAPQTEADKTNTLADAMRVLSERTRQFTKAFGSQVPIDFCKRATNAHKITAADDNAIAFIAEHIIPAISNAAALGCTELSKCAIPYKISGAIVADLWALGFRTHVRPIAPAVISAPVLIELIDIQW